MNPNSLPLSMSTIGRPVRLISIHAGSKLTQRLTSLGLTPGVEMTVVHDAGGPLLIAVRGSRVALGRGMAHKLQVEPVV